MKTHTAADANLLNHMLKFSSAETTKGSSFNRSVEGCKESDFSSVYALSLCFQTEVDSGDVERNKVLSHQTWPGTAVRFVHFTHSSNCTLFLPHERNSSVF